jgi:hypothetical protein
MRNFFLFMLLVNLLAFSYQNWILEPGVSVAPDFLAQDVPLLLQAEQQPAITDDTRAKVDAGPAMPESQTKPNPASVPEAVGAPSPVQVTAYKCLRIGPFMREADVGAVQRELQQRQATVQRTAEAGQVWLGYWVQTVAYPSRQAAEAARKSLINKDMPDVYVIAEDNEYRVSLGVFRLRASADQVVERARKRGFATRLVERYQPGTNYWLIARIAADRVLPAGALPNAPGQILRSERVACSE